MPKRRTVSLDELDHFEIDGEGRLYWQGEQVMTDVKLSLSRQANAAVLIVAVSTFGLFVLAAAQGLGLMSGPTQQINLTIQHQDLERPKSSKEGDQT